jgi:hypothetical protein
MGPMSIEYDDPPKLDPQNAEVYSSIMVTDVKRRDSLT